MGTKRLLAPEICKELATKRNGPVLDLFSGMSAVGQAVGQSRAIWGNDVQRYAYEVIRTLFLDGDTPTLLPDAENCLVLAHEHKDWLRSLASESFSFEDEAGETGTARGYQLLQEKISHNKSFGDLKNLLTLSSVELDRNKYVSFTVNYGGAYFSLDQAAEIDGIRWAIDYMRKDGLLSEATWRRMLVCLGRACLVVSNTTGHFAQFLKPKEQNVARYRATLSRSVGEVFLSVCRSIKPIGTADWRKGNVAFNLEANELLELFEKMSLSPGVIYCDPPYTADHYSRYYHVLETLVLNDTPDLSGAGLYRPDRHSSQFSIKTKVKQAVSEMISRTAACGADIVVSYPLSGLLETPKQFVTDCLTTHYRTVEPIKEISHSHSTMGASKGKERLPVVELLFSASGAR